eukprot:jgi/Bigna1/144395/aug1.87_g19103
MRTGSTGQSKQGNVKKDVHNYSKLKALKVEQKSLELQLQKVTAKYKEMESNMKTLKIERNSLKSENEYLKNSRNTNPIGAEKNINSNSQTDMGLNTKAHGKRRMNKFYVNKVDLQPTNKHSEGNRDAMKRKSIIYKEFDCKIIKELGRGNFAVTYECKLTNGDTVVLKKATVNADVEQFKQEMMGLFNSQGQGSLDKLHDKLDLTMDYAFWKIAQGLLLGLIHLHQNQYIHRDIACRNILVTNNGSIRISGYGLAVRASSGIYLSHPEEMLPWPWMAPETLKSPNRKFTTKSDVWAAGVTLWEILNKGKRRPYNCDRSEVPDICEGKAKLVVPNKWRGTDIEAVVHKCLTFEPDKRPSAYEALIYSTPDGYKQVRKFGTKAMIQKSYNWHSLPQRCLSAKKDTEVVVWNDRLYVIEITSELNTIQYLDLKDRRAEWTMLSQKISSGRRYFGAVVWKSRLLLVGGDRYQHSKSLEYLDLDDPYAGWKQMTQEMKNPTKRPSLAVWNDNLYVVGGQEHGTEFVNSLDLSDKEAKFRGMPNLSLHARLSRGLIILGHLMVAHVEKWYGRDDLLGSVILVDLRDEKNKWTRLAARAMPKNLYWCRLVGMPNFLFLIAGKRFEGHKFLKPIQYFMDLGERGQWKELPGELMREGSAVVYHDQKIYAVGGAMWKSQNQMDTVEWYDLT